MNYYQYYGGNYPYQQPLQPTNPYVHYPSNSYHRGSHEQFYQFVRQQPVRGQATWTDGGQVTQCGIPWSDNQYMTVAVGSSSPYKCGQTLKVRNLSSPVPRELLVEVVDQVADYPPNRLNLHRRAFQAIGGNLNQGVIQIEIIPSPEVEQEKWGKYLLAVTQSAYPSYNVTDYRSVGKTEMSPSQIKETYEFVLQSPQETIKIQGNVIYNPNTNRVISFDLKEL